MTCWKTKKTNYGMKSRSNCVTEHLHNHDGHNWRGMFKHDFFFVKHFAVRRILLQQLFISINKLYPLAIICVYISTPNTLIGIVFNDFFSTNRILGFCILFLMSFQNGNQSQLYITLPVS